MFCPAETIFVTVPGALIATLVLVKPTVCVPAAVAVPVRVMVTVMPVPDGCAPVGVTSPVAVTPFSSRLLAVNPTL